MVIIHNVMLQVVSMCVFAIGCAATRHSEALYGTAIGLSVEPSKSVSHTIDVDVPHVFNNFTLLKLAKLLIRIFFVIVKIRFVVTVAIVAAEVQITLKIVEYLFCTRITIRF